MEFYNTLHLFLFFLLSFFGLREVSVPAPSHMEMEANRRTNHWQLLLCPVSPRTESVAMKKYLNSLFLSVLQSVHPKSMGALLGEFAAVFLRLMQRG